MDQEELLKHLEALAEIRSMYTIYKDFNDQLDKQYKFNSVNFDSSRLPLIDLNYDYILQQLKGYNHDSIVLLAHENIDLSNRFLNEVSLKAFMRYSYYDLETLNPPQRDFVSVGVTLGVPINFNRKYRREYMEVQKDNIAFMPEDERIIIEKGILTNYYEFRYKRKQFTSFHYKKLLYKELLRKQSARFAIDYLSFNPVQSLRLIDDMMKIDIEMLDLKQQMYLKLLSIHVDLPFADINQLYGVKLLDEQLDDIHAAERGVYIWDKTFEENSAEFIQSYLEKQEFQYVVMSFSQSQTFTQQKKQLLDTLHHWGVGISLMTGRNSLIHDENPTAYFDAVLSPLNKGVFSAIHLDVEPHTFDDWQLRKEEYLTQYINLLETMREYTRENKLSLSVSIPLHYPKEYVEQIYELVDKVYFMAYENVKTDYILRKINDFPQNKTVVALRTEDFSNLLEIELKMIAIKAEYSPEYFMIHDLRRLIELEKK